MLVEYLVLWATTTPTRSGHAVKLRTFHGMIDRTIEKQFEKPFNEEPTSTIVAL